MKTYTALFAEDVSYYCTVEIQAETDEQAITQAKEYPGKFNMDFDDPDWNNPVCQRIVHMLDGNSAEIANDVSLDDYFLRSGGKRDRQLCEASADMLRVLKLAKNPHWVHNAGITNDTEALRKICIYYADWWNSQAWPLIRELSTKSETQGGA
jgi:hypothetical protein